MSVLQLIDHIADLLQSQVSYTMDRSDFYRILGNDSIDFNRLTANTIAASFIRRYPRMIASAESFYSEERTLIYMIFAQTTAARRIATTELQHRVETETNGIVDPHVIIPHGHKL